MAEPVGLEEVLPECLVVEIMNRVQDARELAKCCVVSKGLRQAVQNVLFVQLICLKKYYMEARTGPLVRVPFKQAVMNMVQQVKRIEHLKLEIEPEMQANPFQKDEIHLKDFWLSEPYFVIAWAQAVGPSLQHLSLVDYGQQAIMCTTPIIRILAETCPLLKTLELRNMFLDTRDCPVLPHMTGLTLRCIKMMGKGLTDINKCMPALNMLAVVSVFGVEEAKITSEYMQVMCLGLSTKAKTVELNLPNVCKLQLKMACPDSLWVSAPSLAYVAVCMEKREGALVEFEKISNLKELLFGASHFCTLTRLIRNNPLLGKVFLDVPCMELGDDGRWEGVLPDVPLMIPDMKELDASCPCLHTLSIGPGLWYSLETGFENKPNEGEMFKKWPSLKHLIVHIIVLKMDTCLSVLRLISAAVPSLQTLEIYIHADSPVDADHVLLECEEHIAFPFKSGKWKKSLSFSCFSF
ncbi:unnamed protein product [Sphagnum tenellum]